MSPHIKKEEDKQIFVMVTQNHITSTYFMEKNMEITHSENGEI